jgi:hypothetical protein
MAKSGMRNDDLRIIQHKIACVEYFQIDDPGEFLGLLDVRPIALSISSNRSNNATGGPVILISMTALR